MTDPPQRRGRAGDASAQSGPPSEGPAGSGPRSEGPARSRPAGSGPPSKPPMRGAVAGSVLLATLILCAAVGFGLGAAVGAPVPLGIVGVFLGAIAGIVIVARRFSDL